MPTLVEWVFYASSLYELKTCVCEVNFGDNNLTEQFLPSENIKNSRVIFLLEDMPVLNSITVSLQDGKFDLSNVNLLLEECCQNTPLCEDICQEWQKYFTDQFRFCYCKNSEWTKRRRRRRRSKFLKLSH